MAADVSFVFRMMSKGGREEVVTAEGGPLVTRDLLGGCSLIGSKELDLDSRVPSGWEQRLDLMSGEIYLHRSGPIVAEDSKAVHDLNFPPPSSSSAAPGDLRSLNAGTLDLTLNLPSTVRNHSVCTLEKVRSALEQAEHRATIRKRSECSPSSPASSSSASASASSDKSSASGEKPAGSSPAAEEDRSSGAMFAAGCPSCLLYVLISGRNPKCPRCDAIVPLPSSASPAKKPRLDLNSCII